MFEGFSGERGPLDWAGESNLYRMLGSLVVFSAAYPLKTESILNELPLYYK